MSTPMQLVGRTLANLTVTRQWRDEATGKQTCEAVCTCGNIVTMLVTRVGREVRSCGCLRVRGRMPFGRGLREKIRKEREVAK